MTELDVRAVESALRDQVGATDSVAREIANLTDMLDRTSARADEAAILARGRCAFVSELVRPDGSRIRVVSPVTDEEGGRLITEALAEGGERAHRVEPGQVVPR